jgi:hypothetical protein
VAFRIRPFTMPVACRPVTGTLATPVAVTESTALVDSRPVSDTEESADTDTSFVNVELDMPVTFTSAPAPSTTVTDPTALEAAMPVTGMFGASPDTVTEPTAPVASTPETPITVSPLIETRPTEPVAS